jgi:hypothetical protein
MPICRCSRPTRLSPGRIACAGRRSPKATSASRWLDCESHGAGQIKSSLAPLAASMPAPRTSQSPAAAPLTSRPNRYVSATSTPRKPAPCCSNTLKRPGRCSPRRLWRRSGR